MSRRVGDPDSAFPFELDESWLTPVQAAVTFKKSLRTIRRYCKDGTFVDAGFKVRRNISGEWFIRFDDRTAKTL